MNIANLAFYGFTVDYSHMADGFILVSRPNACITDDDLATIRATVNAPEYMVWRSGYQTVTIG